MDAGITYEYAVMAFVAAKLLNNDNVQDYRIYFDVPSAGKFNDVVIRVRLKDSDQWYLGLIQVKFKSTKLLSFDHSHMNSLKNYVDSFCKILDNPELPCRRGIPKDNIRFAIFCNTSIQKPIRTMVATSLFNVSLHTGLETDYITRTLFPFDKSGSSFVCDELEDTNFQSFFHNCHLYLNQLGYHHIKRVLRSICGIDNADDIISYIKNYISSYFLKKQGLSKHQFEIELQRMRLYNSIISVSKFEKLVDQQQITIWNKIVLAQDITIVDNRDDLQIDQSLLSYWSQALNSLLNIDINWGSFVAKNEFLTDDIIELFKIHSKTKPVRYWVTLPDTFKSLLVELWKCGDLPLILKGDYTLSFFEKHKNLHRSYVIIDDLQKRLPEISTSKLRIFSHLGNIENQKLQDDMLRCIIVSLQGRSPTTLKELIDNDKDLMASLTCSEIIALMKKRTVLLKENCWVGTNYSIFFIEDATYTGIVTFSEPYEIGDNIKITCHPNQVDQCIKIIMENPSYQNYKIYILRRTNDQLQLVSEDKYALGNNFVDQYGDYIYYRHEGAVFPILGQVIPKEINYIDRSLTRPTISKAYFDFVDKKICLLSGEVDTIDKELKLVEVDLNRVQANLTKRENYFLRIDSKERTNCWSKLSNLTRPLLDINIRNGKLELLQFRHCRNLNSHIIYNGKSLSEEQFIEEIGQKNNGITVVIGEPGMGKSSLLRRLSNNCYTKNYILFFDLLDLEFNLYSSRDMYAKFMDFIFDKFHRGSTKKYTNFVSTLRRMNRIMLVLDSFNEIVGVCENQVLEFIQFIDYTGAFHIIVATSREYCDLLFKKHNVQTVKIEPLKDKENEYFVKGILNKRVLNGVPTAFTRNPLYLKFLRMLYETQHPTKPFNNFFLFGMLIDMKIKHRFQETHRRFTDSDIEETSSVFQKLALVAAIGKETVEKLLMWSYNKKIHDKIKFGIVTNFDIEENPEFYHPVFVEFLCADWILNSLNVETSRHVAKDVYKQMMKDRKLSVLHILTDHLELHKAITEEHVLKVQEICDRSRSSLKITDKLGRTALHMAALCCQCSGGSEKSLKILEIIIESMQQNQYDMDNRDNIMNWDWTDYVHADFHSDSDSKVEGELNMLHISCIHGNLTMAQYFIEKCVHVNMVDEYGYTPLDYTMARLASTAVSTQMEHDLTSTVKEDMDVMQLLLGSNADINRRNEHANCDTPLCFAVRVNNLDILHILLQNKNKINVDLRGRDGKTPLYIATETENISIIKLLLEHKANVNHQNKDGRTPLHFVVETLNLDVAKLLLESEADVHIEDRNGETPLSIVEAQESEDFIKLLQDAAQRNKHNSRPTLELNHEQGINGTLNIPKKALKRTSGAQSELGMIYQYTVTSLLAAKLASHPNVKDYIIYSSESSAGKFDDIVARVQLKSPDECFLCLLQVKFKDSKKLNVSDTPKESFISDYVNSYHEILKDPTLACRQGISDDKIRFGIFSNKYLKTPVNLYTASNTFQLSVHPDSKVDTITQTLFPFNKEYYKFCCQDLQGTEYDTFLNACHLCLNQLNCNKILSEIRNICKIDNANDVITYIKDYFNDDFLYKQGLSKHIFEIELQKIRFCNSIIPLTQFTQLVDGKQVDIWNKIVLEQEITIVDNNCENIENCLLSCWIQNLNSLFNDDINWGAFVNNNEPISSKILDKFRERSKTKPHRYWISQPDNFKSLLIELWKCGDLPLILKTDINLTDFLKYRHLKRRYVVVDDLQRRLQEIYDTDLKIFSHHLGSIKNLRLRENMLQNTIVSLQGRKPITLENLIANDKKLIEAVTCTDIVDTLKKRTVYLKESCLNYNRYSIFLIEDNSLPKDSIENGTESGKLRYKPGNNIKVYCHPSKAQSCANEIQADFQYKDYAFCHLRTTDKHFQVLKCDRENQFQQYFIDQYGDPVYSLCNPVPVIGRRIFIEDNSYIPRNLLKYSSYENFTSGMLQKRYRQNEFFEEIKSKTKGITVITGEPGMGKSSLLKSLCNECDSNNYILFYDLVNFETCLHNSEDFLKQPIEFIFKEFHKTKIKNFNELVCTFCKRRRVVVILDSFDEILERYKGQVLKFIESINPSEVQIIIASRLMACEFLAKHFDLEIISIEPLSNDNDNDYLMNWKLNKEELENIPKEFVTIPLYLNFLKLISESQERFENNKYMLYEQVINLKIKTCLAGNNQRVRKSDVQQKISFFQKLALKVVLRRDKTQYLIDMLKDELVDDIEFGIVTRFDDEGYPSFYHSTFVEFLVTRFIKFNQQGISRSFAQDVYLQLLLDEKLHLLNIAFDHLDLHKAVANINVPKVEELLSDDEKYNCVDMFGRTALHIAAICCRSSNEEQNSQKILELLLEYMRNVDYGTYDRCDAIMGWQWSDYIDSYKSF